MRVNRNIISITRTFLENIELPLVKRARRTGRGTRNRLPDRLTSALTPRSSAMLSLRGLRGLTLASLACGASSFTMSHFAAGAALRRTSPTAVTSRRLLSRGGATRATPCMASAEHFDYLVIGGGSGGVSSARRAATYDAKVWYQLDVIYNKTRSFEKHEHMTRDQSVQHDTWPPLLARLSMVPYSSMCTAVCTSNTFHL